MLGGRDEQQDDKSKVNYYKDNKTRHWGPNCRVEVRKDIPHGEPEK